MFKKSVAIMALLAGLSATHAQALSLRQGAQPAETPPAGYKGDTYVDSRGCIYIRAGFAGNTTWVPRVNRDRKVVCGVRPTSKAVPAPVQPARPQTPQQEVQTPTRQIAVQRAPQRGQSATSTQRIQRLPPANTTMRGPDLPPRIGFGPNEVNPALPPRSAGPKPWMQRQTGAQFAGQASGQMPGNPVGMPTVAPVANLSDLDAASSSRTAAPVVSAVAGEARIVEDNGRVTRAVRVKCPAKAGKVAFVRLNGAKLPVRCGPQQIAPVTYVVMDGAGHRTRITTLPHPSTVQAVSASQRGARNGAYAAPALPGTTISVQQGNGHPPRNYRVVRSRDLDKSTLPPDTVIAPKTYIASNMPVQVPQGYKPAWQDGRLNPMRGVRTIAGDAQTAGIWQEGTPRKLVEVEVPKPRSAGLFQPRRQAAKTLTTGTKRVKAARSVGAARASHRYVQVGGFANPNNARKVIMKLQRMGLTVSSTTSRTGVKTILAGPFARQAQLTSALGKLRSAGFRDAFLRK